MTPDLPMSFRNTAWTLTKQPTSGILFARCANSWMAVATLAAISGGCAVNNGVTKKQNVPAQARPVARVATREELLEKYNAFASSVKTLNATVELKTTAGSQYSGLIQ